MFNFPHLTKNAVKKSKVNRGMTINNKVINEILTF